MVNVYAILDAEGRCINRVLWDGASPWQPPKDCTAIEDPDNLYPLVSLSLETTVVDSPVETNTPAAPIAESGVTTDLTATPNTTTDLTVSGIL